MRQEHHNLERIECPRCGQEAGQVIHAESRTRTGWFCPHCKHYEKALLRERSLVSQESRA